MFVSVASASTNRFEITPDVNFDSFRVLIRVSLSKMFPSEVNKSFKIWSSMDFNCALSALILKQKVLFYFLKMTN